MFRWTLRLLVFLLVILELHKVVLVVIWVVTHLLHFFLDNLLLIYFWLFWLLLLWNFYGNQIWRHHNVEELVFDGDI